MICSVEGLIRGVPEVRRTWFQGKESVRTSVSLGVRNWRRGSGEWRPAKGVVVSSVQGLLPAEFREGCRVEVTGVLRRPPRSGVPGAFDYRGYLERNGVFFELAQSRVQDWRWRSAPTGRWTDGREGLQAWGREALAAGLPDEDEALRLIWAMTLGWKQGLDRDVAEPFVQSGTMHVFAISGLHIALVAWIVLAAMRGAGVSRETGGLIVIPLLWAYTWVTGWQPSAVRSSVMMTVVAMGWIMRRPGNVLNSLAGAAICLLLWDPQQLFQPGFQLSFCVVLCLATLGGSLQSWFEDTCFAPSLVPRSHQPWWMPGWQRAKRAILMNLSISVSSWMGSLPLIAWYFHLVSVVSLLANLVVVPLSSLCLMSSLASLVMGPVWQGGGELLNHGSWFWMRLMMKVSEWAATLPGGWFHVPQPGFLLMVLYYLLLTRIWLGARVSHRKRRTITLTGVGLAVVVLGQPLMESASSRIHLIPRRAGAAAWIDPAGLEPEWLLDPGDPWSVKHVTIPFLQAAGVNHIDHLVVTHAGTASAGGAPEVESRFRVGRRHAPSPRFRSQPFRRWLQSRSSFVPTPELLSAGRQLGPWEVLHPPARQGSTTADESPLVLKGRFSGVRVLWLPPLDSRGQDRLLASGRDLRADLVIVQIPGRGEPLLDPLLRAIGPRILIVADDLTPVAAGSRAGGVERLRRGVPLVWRMSETGYLEIRLRGGIIDIRPPNASVGPAEGDSLPGGLVEEK